MGVCAYQHGMCGVVVVVELEGWCAKLQPTRPAQDARLPSWTATREFCAIKDSRNDGAIGWLRPSGVGMGFSKSASGTFSCRKGIFSCLFLNKKGEGGGGWVVIIPAVYIQILVFCEVCACMACVVCGGVQLGLCGGGAGASQCGAQDARPPATCKRA